MRDLEGPLGAFEGPASDPCHGEAAGSGHWGAAGRINRRSGRGAVQQFSLAGKPISERARATAELARPATIAARAAPMPSALMVPKQQAGAAGHARWDPDLIEISEIKKSRSVRESTRKARASAPGTSPAKAPTKRLSLYKTHDLQPRRTLGRILEPYNSLKNGTQWKLHTIDHLTFFHLPHSPVVAGSACACHR